MTNEAHHALTELVRVSGRDVLATLVGFTGDLGLAEDAVQDAALRALEVWPREGVPANPVAWLRLTARRRAIDLIRREASRSPKEAAAMFSSPASVPPPVVPEGEPSAGAVDDDLLRLIFTCCHPSLSPETQISLALKTLCGLTTAEVARALLVPEATMAKRLTRARQKIKVAKIPYRIPDEAELPERWSAVLATTYLMFNEGYAATGGPTLIRRELVEEAIRLGRLLIRLRPESPGARGLLALMVLQDSRREARTGLEGEVILLADQDRLRWRADLIGEGVNLVGDGLRNSPDAPDRYVVQAAIAACHALAPTYDETDWDAMISWYDVLLRLDPSPVVRLNRAVAVAERDGPEAGLAVIDQIEGLDGYGLWHASRAVLLRRLGRDHEAREADARASALPLNEPQLRLLQP